LLEAKEKLASSISIVVVLLSAHLHFGSGFFSGFYGVGSVHFYEMFAVLLQLQNADRVV